MRAPRIGWTATTYGEMAGYPPDYVFDDDYSDWMLSVFIGVDDAPLNWYQIDMSQQEVGIYKVEIIKRLDRPLRFAVSLLLHFDAN